MPRSARYREMVVALRERGIEPMVTLHHFDHPVWFEDLGGFANPDSVALFLRFARRAVEALGDVCSEWVTFNEPNVYATVGLRARRLPARAPRRHAAPRSACRQTWLALTRLHTR